MKKIIDIVNHDESESVIKFHYVDHCNPIFAKKDGKLKGMIVRESKGWILRVGGMRGSSGHHEKLIDCLMKDKERGYDFYVEE